MPGVPPVVAGPACRGSTPAFMAKNDVKDGSSDAGKGGGTDDDKGDGKGDGKDDGLDRWIVTEDACLVAVEASHVFGSSYKQAWCRLYEDYLLFFENKDHETPWLCVLVVQIRGLKPSRGDVKLRMQVWGTVLKLKFCDKNTTLRWHTLLQPRLELRHKHPFGSFASPKPVSGRPEERVRFFNTGAEYYTRLADVLLAARSEIFITGWWMSYHIYLKRDTLPPDPKFRLDNLLQFKAQQGVQIYILLYKEPPGLVLGHAMVKQQLELLHPNIKVVLHGPAALAQLLYSHHQKTAVVDQRVAFVGGLDLCVGRYDTPEHPLMDQTRPYTRVHLSYGLIEPHEDHHSGPQDARWSQENGFYPMAFEF